MIWNETNHEQRSGNSNESGEHANYWEDAVEFMGAEMRPFVALMEELLPSTDQLSLAGPHATITTLSEPTKRWNPFRKN